MKNLAIGLAVANRTSHKFNGRFKGLSTKVSVDVFQAFFRILPDAAGRIGIAPDAVIFDAINLAASKGRSLPQARTDSHFAY